MKKILTAVLACVLMVSMLPVGAAAKKTVYLPTKTTSYSKNADGKMEKSSVATYKYNKKGIEQKFRYVNYINGKKSGEYTATYKIKKNRIVSSVSTNTSGTETSKSKTIMHYKKGQNTKNVFYQYDKTKKKFVKTGYTTYKISSKKSIAKYYYDGKLSSKTVNYLNKKGLITKSLSYEGNSKLVYTETRAYNKKGLLKKVVIKSASGDKTVYTYTYKYDKHGNPTTQFNYNYGKLYSKSVTKYKKFTF